jgi:hypothetical protein
MGQQYGGRTAYTQSGEGATGCTKGMQANSSDSTTKRKEKADPPYYAFRQER